jgi:hypothetical protein
MKISTRNTTMPELSNTVAVVTGRRIGLGRAKTLVQTRRLLGARVFDAYLRIQFKAADVAAQVLADGVGVPLRPRQQVLQPVGRGVPEVLGQGPAVQSRQFGHQPADQLPGRTPGLDPGEPWRDPGHQPIELHPPSIKVHAGGSGHRAISAGPHNSR